MRKRITIEDVNNRKPSRSRLTAVEIIIGENKKSLAKAQCSCGNKIIAQCSSIINGNTTSCGCQHKESMREKRESVESINNKVPKQSRLTVVAYNDDKYGRNIKKEIIAMCDCGKVIILAKADFLRGISLSCGCYKIEMIKRRMTKWRYPNIKVYYCHRNMVRRCYDKKDKSYKHYGGRGVKVCHSWLLNPQKFIDWAISNGWKDGLHLDKDIKGDGMLYSPKNCCFITAKENNLHRRRKNKPL